VLRPGGRLSIFEPINRFGLEGRRATWGFRDLADVEDLIERLVAEASREEGRAGGLDAMIDFDERDLVCFAEEAGFESILLTLHAEVTKEAKWRSTDWDVFLDSSPNPLAPTLREAMTAALEPDEQARLTAVIRPQVEAGIGTTRLARAFLAAQRPSD
jgi:arsenite methyltransferase